MTAIAFIIPSIERQQKAPRQPPFILRMLRKAFGDRPLLASDKIVARTVGLDWVASAIVLGGASQKPI